jgi:phosphatidylinositol-3-phosphatase
VPALTGGPGATGLPAGPAAPAAPTHPGSGPAPAPAPAPSGGTPTAAKPCGLTTSPPAWQHVVWIVMENHASGQIIGSSSAPYLNGLKSKCGYASNFYAESHPSLPNYIAMTSGSTQGITDDNPPSSHPLNVPSIFSQLGGGWKSLQESMPSNCALTSSGTYAVKHNPAAYYTNIRPACSTQDVPLGSTPDVSAKFTFITPNLCSDMHDCSVSTGDSWLGTWVPKILDSAAYTSGTTAVFITFDEDDKSDNNHIATLVLSPSTPAGMTDSGSYNHYSMLRTTEEMLGLPVTLGGAVGAMSMRAGFHL